MLAKFEQNWIKPDYFLTIVDKVLVPFWKTFLYLKQLFDAKSLIQRLPSFSVPKMSANREVSLYVFNDVFV